MDVVHQAYLNKESFMHQRRKQKTTALIFGEVNFGDNMVSLSDIRRVDRDRGGHWFDTGAKRFFNDISYKILHGKKTGYPFLVRSTYAWSDMFTGEKKLHYRVNEIHPSTLSIGGLIDEKFESMEHVKEWLKNH
jgi:hypothetical protein